jgi:hypothetical protein
MFQLSKSQENFFSLLKCWKYFIHPINPRVISLGLGSQQSKINKNEQFLLSGSLDSIKFTISFKNNQLIIWRSQGAFILTDIRNEDWTNLSTFLLVLLDQVSYIYIVPISIQGLNHTTVVQPRIEHIMLYVQRSLLYIVQFKFIDLFTISSRQWQIFCNDQIVNILVFVGNVWSLLQILPCFVLLFRAVLKCKNYS